MGTGRKVARRGGERPDAARAWARERRRIDARKDDPKARAKVWSAPAQTRNWLGQLVQDELTECAKGVWLAPGESTPWRRIPGSGAFIREVGQGTAFTPPPGFKKYERPSNTRQASDHERRRA